MKKQDFAFLKSVRFWKLFVVAVVQFLASQAVVSTEVANGISLILLGSVTVRTIDRFGEKVAKNNP
mgnify:CR=1 FL=1